MEFGFGSGSAMEVKGAKCTEKNSSHSLDGLLEGPQALDLELQALHLPGL